MYASIAIQHISDFKNTLSLAEDMTVCYQHGQIIVLRNERTLDTTSVEFLPMYDEYHIKTLCGDSYTFISFNKALQTLRALDIIN